jgi:hypothetical protein
MPFPKVVRDLEGRDAQLFGQQSIPIIRIFDFLNDGSSPRLTLVVFVPVNGRRRISLLSLICRQIVNCVVRLRELAAAQHGRKVVFRQPVEIKINSSFDIKIQLEN